VTAVLTATAVADTSLARPVPRRRHRQAAAALGVALLALIVLSAGIGAVRIEPAQVLAILLAPLGVSLPWQWTEQQELVLWAVRIPRIVHAVLVGGALAAAGAALQGIFRNPLADPALIGVSAGASLAAAIVIVLGIGTIGVSAVEFGMSVTGAFSVMAVPVAAFAGGLAATVLVLRVTQAAAIDGSPSHGTATLLLCGIAINALAGAGVGFVTFLATDSQLRDIAFWSLGTLGGATWGVVAVTAPCLLATILLLPRHARALNLLVLGEAEATHLGIRVARVRRAVIVLAALGVGAAVASSGVIGFVGLVVPHVVRLALGPEHRSLLVLSTLLGGTLLLGADLVARTVAAPAELPIGVVTAALGAPFFLWLVVRQNRAAVQA
jgi:iron complex transport system permease protein